MNGMDIVNDVPTVVILLVASLIIGCIFGSFLNVVIWRVPNHISITNPKRSFCPKCESPIAWYDNIPIFSWLHSARNADTAKNRLPHDIRWSNRLADCPSLP